MCNKYVNTVKYILKKICVAKKNLLQITILFLLASIRNQFTRRISYNSVFGICIKCSHYSIQIPCANSINPRLYNIPTGKAARVRIFSSRNPDFRYIANDFYKTGMPSLQNETNFVKSVFSLDTRLNRASSKFRLWKKPAFSGFRKIRY